MVIQWMMLCILHKKIQKSSAVFVSSFVFRTKCVCDNTAMNYGKSCSIEIYIYIYKYNTYMKMFTVWICIECLHRISKGEVL